MKHPRRVANRLDVARCKCSIRGAAPGLPCTGYGGKTRLSYHAERWTAARVRVRPKRSA